MNKELQPQFVDRSKWDSGPWDAEEFDKAEWTDEATGYDCLALRGPMGHWCGYVGIPEGHVLFGVGYDEIPDHERDKIEVHGGLTYADKDGTLSMEEGEIGERNLWRFGFDCNHSGDIAPAYSRLGLGYSWPVTYKDFEYVKQECEDLARALCDLALARAAH